MRRKKRFGVYSNGTIKRCFCNHNYCKECKGPCKAGFRNAKVDPDSNPHDGILSLYAIQSAGKGSLLPGKRFCIYDRMKDFKYALKRKMSEERKREKRRNLKLRSQEEYEGWYFLGYFDEKIANSR